MTVTLFVGSANRSGNTIRSDCGISVIALDEASLAASSLHVESHIDNPSYLVVAPERGMVYAVSEVVEWAECTLSAYRIDRASKALAYVNKQPTRGLTTCHVALLPGNRLGIANYSHGSGGPDQAVCFYPLDETGALGAPDASAPHRGPSGPVADRQERSHAHCVLPTLDGKAVLIADLGLDCIVGYAPSAPAEELFRLSLPGGYGPRHIVSHPNGRTLYVLNELQPAISVLGWDGQTLTHLHDVPTLDAGDLNAETAGAAIHLSADGACLYASTRGVDRISVFSLGEDERRPVLRQTIACGGRWPRDFSLTPSGAHLVVANQFTDDLAIFARDPESGLLRDTGTRIAVPAPQCVKMLAD